jgi:hypothetical protein
MRFRLIRHVILVITLGAFLSADVMQLMWPIQATASPAMTMTMAYADGANADGAAPMPCQGKGMTSDCMTDLGCVFMIGLPTTPATLTMTFLTWKRVNYSELTQLAVGLTRKPALDPPIFFG